MNQLRLDADSANAKVEELQAKIKALEQESLSKEQEITSLQHKNGVLEGQVEKLEGDVDKHKKLADEGSGSITQNEALQRRLQLLEEEAEEADKTLREANEKYVRHGPVLAGPCIYCSPLLLCEAYMGPARREDCCADHMRTDFDRPTSRPDTSSGRCRPSRTSVTSGRTSMRRCRRSTATHRRRSRSSSGRSVPSDRAGANGGQKRVRGRRRNRKAGRERNWAGPWEAWPDIMSAQINTSVKEPLGFITRQGSCKRAVGLKCVFVSGRQLSFLPQLLLPLCPRLLFRVFYLLLRELPIYL